MPRMFIVLFFLPVGVFAQKQLNLTFNGGVANYSGDLQEKRFTFDQSNLTIGAGLSYELAPKFLIRGQLQYGSLSANDKFSPREALKQRNLNFRSRLVEASLLADYSLFDLVVEKKITPYVFAGLSIFRVNPFTYDQDDNKVYLRNLSTEGQGLAQYPDRKPYSVYNISIPFGGGLRYRINENTYLGYELGLRKTFTDYIDDVSTNYVDEAILRAAKGARAVDLAFRTDELKSDEPYPAAGTIRGGSKYKDWYYFSTITLSIGIMNDGRLFGKKSGRGSVDCPIR